MSNEIGYCHAWPEELKAAWRRVNRLQCKLRCLNSNVEKIDYEDFDELMCELEKTQQELFEAHSTFDELNRMWGTLLEQHTAKSRQSKNGPFCNVAAKRKDSFL